MRIKIKNLTPKANMLNPTIECDLTVEFYPKEDLIIYFDGTLELMGKIVGKLNYGICHQEMYLQPDKPDHFFESYFFKSDIDLTKESVSFIHNSREKSEGQDIQFTLKASIRTLKNNNHSSTKIYQNFDSYRISSSDWIRTFCPAFEIGNFSIIEVNHASLIHSVISEANQPLYELLESANQCFYKGDYIEVIYNCRKFFESVRNLSKEIENYSNQIINTDEYGKEINKLINSAFQIISKYHHSYSLKKEELKLNVGKNDAQMVLYFSMSIATFLTRIFGNVV
ncbi:hypothetical protein ND860_17890 [Leptospira levettii]|uniref:hypothetical protein n=1 Tax=Leptospira levettii TaxID=2023178 RepID=UPI00223E1182|nr:hypothetical protein [Leptospira levettii]MCW7498413.1 hypothetical protein [Leptospira levettii]